MLIVSPLFMGSTDCPSKNFISPAVVSIKFWSWSMWRGWDGVMNTLRFLTRRIGQVDGAVEAVHKSLKKLARDLSAADPANADKQCTPRVHLFPLFVARVPPSLLSFFVCPLPLSIALAHLSLALSHGKMTRRGWVEKFARWACAGRVSVYEGTILTFILERS